MIATAEVDHVQDSSDSWNRGVSRSPDVSLEEFTKPNGPSINKLTHHSDDDLLAFRASIRPEPDTQGGLERPRQPQEVMKPSAAMGLELFQLSSEVEESFGITIPKGNAIQLRTVGDLYNCVLERVQENDIDPGTYATATTFYSLRKRLASHVQDAKSIRPSTNVAETIPAHDRRRMWEQLSLEMNLRFPSLDRPEMVSLLSMTAVAILTLVASIAYVLILGPVISAVITVFTFLLAWRLMSITTSRFATLLSPSIETFRGLVTQLVLMNTPNWPEGSQPWSPSEVWSVLQRTIVDQLGVRQAEVTPQADFVHDLGCS